MERFTNFVSDVHPDPDYLLSRTVEGAFKELGKLADHYHNALGKTHCERCGNKLDKISIKKKRKICTPCFTSNS